MKAHLAKIFNFTCDRDPKHWWSVDGIEPVRGQVLFCPHCGHRNIVEEIVDHTVQLEPADRIFEKELPTVNDMIGILSVEGDRT